MSEAPHISDRQKEGLRTVLEDLRKMTEACRGDMHEPDENGISAIVSGYRFDNAMGSHPARNQGEFTVGLRYLDGGYEWFNLADLIALARQANI